MYGSIVWTGMGGSELKDSDGWTGIQGPEGYTVIGVPDLRTGTEGPECEYRSGTAVKRDMDGVRNELT